jgi:hypothetical protein
MARSNQRRRRAVFPVTAIPSILYQLANHTNPAARRGIGRDGSAADVPAGLSPDKGEQLTDRERDKLVIRLAQHTPAGRLTAMEIATILDFVEHCGFTITKDDKPPAQTRKSENE